MISRLSRLRNLQSRAYKERGRYLYLHITIFKLPHTQSVSYALGKGIKGHSKGVQSIGMLAFVRRSADFAEVEALIGW